MILAASIAFLVPTSLAIADPAPELSQQPRTDTFIIEPWGDLDQFNPLSHKVRTTGQVIWDYQVMPGCNTAQGATIGQTIGAAMGNIYFETGVVFTYVQLGDPASDLTIRTNCGSSFTAVCGNGAAACLGRQFPYNLDIDFSQDVATYFDVSRITVVLHELFGHALATWNEQYQPNFSASPNWVDVMNTGPDSRHYIQGIELSRWGRTMGTPAPTSYGLGPGYVWFCGVSSRASYVDLFGSSSTAYRYIGTVPLSNLQESGGCYGLATAFYIHQDECAAIRLGNYADYMQNAFRSDRTVCD